MKSNYEFTETSITAEQERFVFYLQQKGFAPATRKMYCNYTGYFLSWKTQERLQSETTYTELLTFIEHCRKQNRSTTNINRILTALRYYFGMLQGQKQRKQNPAASLYLRGETERIPHDLLERDHMNLLYEKYQVYDERTQRNKVILGLYIYQAITTDELRKLEPQHVKLKEGKIYIPGTRQTVHKGGSQSRWLQLEAKQILDLQEYLLTTRPKIIAAIKSGERNKHPTRKPKTINEKALEHQLFISVNGSENIKSSVSFLMNDLRKINPLVKDAMQIRKSVITNWLKEKDIRTVQYMAGHKRIHATEKYRAANTEELAEALRVHHPLK